MSIGDRIKSARKAVPLTQSELGKKLNVSQSMIAQYEKGDRIPNDDTLQKIAAILGVPYYTLSEEDNLENTLRTQENLMRSLLHDRENLQRWIDTLNQSLQLKHEEKELCILKQELKYIDNKLAITQKNIEELRTRLMEMEELKYRLEHFKEGTERNERERKIILAKLEKLQMGIPDILKKNDTRYIMIDTTIDQTSPFNIIQKKIDNGEQLTPEELAQYKEHISKAIPSIRQTLENFGESLKKSFSQYYALLNDEGRKEADIQIKRAIERVTEQAENQAKEEAENQIKLLTRIPEYQKKQDD